MLEMELDSFVAQGDVAAQRSVVTKASSYYKAARKQLVDFNMQYPEKNNCIRELSHEHENAGKHKNGFPTDPGSDEEQKNSERFSISQSSCRFSEWRSFGLDCRHLLFVTSSYPWFFRWMSWTRNSLILP